MAFTDVDSNDYSDSSYEDENQPEGEDGAPPEESSNRTFIIVAVILGAIFLLTLLCTAGYALVVMPGQRNAERTEVAQVSAQNTQIAMDAASTLEASQATRPPVLPPTFTPTPQNTQVVVVQGGGAGASTTSTPPTADPRTATVAALLTQASNAAKTVVPTSTALPNTGFADDVGMPALLGMAIVLVVVIFLARRLRTAS